MKKYAIHLVTYSDSTIFTMELTDDQYKLIKKVSELSEQNALRLSQPILVIEEAIDIKNLFRKDDKYE
jgi:hypothetical protein